MFTSYSSEYVQYRNDDVIGYSVKHIFTKSKNTILSTDKDFSTISG